MVHSKYLDSQTPQQRELLLESLYELQSHRCFICEEPIDKSLQSLDIDHVIPIAGGGKDDPSNFALTHAPCNREKQDTNLLVARSIKRYDKIRDKVYAETHRAPDLSQILSQFGGSKFEIKFTDGGNRIRYTEEEVGGTTIHENDIVIDGLSGFRSFFSFFPIEYVFHDERGINPRTLSDRVKELVKEFSQKRPQLHVGLARINYDGVSGGTKTKVFIFDGQHKAAAQLLLGQRQLLLRVFVNPPLETLTQTNERAGDTLRQIAFDLSVRRQLGSTILSWKIETYQREKGLRNDDYSFSEKDLAGHYKGEGRETRKFILDRVRNDIVSDKENRLRDYISFGGKEKDRPISYSTVDSTLFSLLLSKEILDSRPFFNKKRENEISNMIRLMNLISSEILTGYDFEIGSFKIEDEVRKEREGHSAGRRIPDEHLRSTRMVKEEIMFNWVRHIKQIILQYFAMGGTPIDEEKILQDAYTEILWTHIKNYLRNLKNLPVWVDREKTHVFSAKLPQNYWHEVFKTGKAEDGTKVLLEGINLVEMIKEAK